jgi:hypothetical protein
MGQYVFIRLYLTTRLTGKPVMEDRTYGDCEYELCELAQLKYRILTAVIIWRESHRSIYAVN